MSRDPRRTERKRLKRKLKQREIRKLKHRSPFARLDKPAGPLEVYMNVDWHSVRQASIICLRPLRDGTYAFAGFLVDQGVAGLKDAWGQFDVTRESVLSSIVRGLEEHEDVRLERVDAEHARRVIAGAIRFAHDNGFRLPRDFEKWLKIFDGPTDWGQADTSEFVMEFVGHPDDLRRRLVTMSYDDFLRRDDVRFVLSVEAPMLDDVDLAGDDDDDSEDESDEDEEFNILRSTAEGIAGAARRWCVSRGKIPHANLDLAAGFFIAATSMVMSEEHDPNSSPRADLFRKLDQLMSALPADKQLVFRPAVKQMREFMEQSADLGAFLDDTAPEEEG
ncbi:MAG: hypothetical protein ACREIT_11485 [Tepidisphaeraceae bacterium]